MEPTLNASGDIVVFEHISPRWGTLEPGDVVVARSPSSPHSYICKRVKVVVSLVCALPTVLTNKISML